MRKVYHVDADYGRTGVHRETMIASSVDEIVERLRERGAELIDAQIMWSHTINMMARKGFDLRELGQVYRTMGRRIGQSAKHEDALGQAGALVTDPVLKVALADAQAGVASGQRIDEAMRSAGMPDEDASLVRAMSEAGGVADAFMGMAESYAQQATLRGKLTSLSIEPVIYTTIVALMVWGSFLFMIPRFSSFFGKAGLKPPAGISEIYAFDGWVHLHAWPVSIVYWALFAAGGWFLIGSKTMARAWRSAPILRDILWRVDAAQAFSAFALLYESAIRRSEAARRVAATCRSIALRDAFQRFGEFLDAGAPQTDAAERADFPPFVAATLKGALSSNDPESTVQDLRIVSGMLTEDVEVLSRRREHAVRLIFLMLTGLMVVGVFCITIFPEIAVTFSNA